MQATLQAVQRSPRHGRGRLYEQVQGALRSYSAQMGAQKRGVNVFVARLPAATTATKQSTSIKEKTQPLEEAGQKQGTLGEPRQKHRRQAQREHELQPQPAATGQRDKLGPGNQPASGEPQYAPPSSSSEGQHLLVTTQRKRPAQAMHRRTDSSNARDERQVGHTHQRAAAAPGDFATAAATDSTKTPNANGKQRKLRHGGTIPSYYGS